MAGQSLSPIPDSTIPSRSVPRVAIVVPALSARGGLAALALFLYRTLAASGRYEPHLISLATSSRDPNSIRLADPRSWRGVRITRDQVEGLPFLHVGSAGAEIEILRYQPRRQLTSMLEEFDLVQLIGGTPAFAHVARNVSRPVALWCATMVAAERRALLRQGGLATNWRRLMTWFVNRMDYTGLGHVEVVFVINKWMRDLVAGALGDHRVHLSPPGVDTDVFRPQGAPVRDVVLAVGRLDDPRKNIRLLVEAFALFQTGAPRPFRLVLAGERPPTADVLNRARELGVSEAIDLRISVSLPDLVRLYQEATLFALTSDEEGLGIAAIEAMACGVPVVATQCGGPEVSVIDGETGFLVPVGDAATFAARMEVLARDEELRRHMGQASRSRVEHHFSLSHTGDVFLQTYDELLASRRGIAAVASAPSTVA